VGTWGGMLSQEQKGGKKRCKKKRGGLKANHFGAAQQQLEKKDINEILDLKKSWKESRGGMRKVKLC